MKRILLFAPLLIIAAMLTGCAGSSNVNADLSDGQVADAQADAKKACYAALKGTRPDMSTWKPEQIMAYAAIEKLGDANKIIAKVPTDPCAAAGGTNVYDAKIVALKEGTKRQENWMDFGKDLATKGLYGTIAVFGFDYLKDANDKGDTIIEMPADEDPFLEEFGEDVDLEVPDVPEITP